MTLEQPPIQNAGGGINSSLLLEAVTGALINDPVESGNVHTTGKGIRTEIITLNGPLADGDSINVQFLLGVQKQGNFRFLLNIEAITGASPGPPPLGLDPSGDGDLNNKSGEPRAPTSKPGE